MSIIYKYPIGRTFGTFAVPMPEKATILHVDIQGEEFVAWAMVHNPVGRNRVERTRTFSVLPTGVEFSAAGKYLTTIQDGVVVFHIFDGGFK